MNYDSPAQIRAVLADLGVRLKKRWGQNFLVNRQARARIVELLELEPADTVWEIGAGLGCMTADLLPRVRRLFAFEIDHGLIRYLEKAFAGYSGFNVVPGDALRTWKQVWQREGTPGGIIGNLPYSSASAIIGSFAESDFRPARMAFTVQRELAARMTAQAGSSSYSSFSVLCRYVYDVRSRFELKPGSFYPAPEVVSAVVELTPRTRERSERERAFFLSLVRALFLSRRKTLWNNLKAWKQSRGCPAGRLREALEAEGIGPQRRGEELEVEELVSLARRLRPLLEV